MKNKLIFNLVLAAAATAVARDAEFASAPYMNAALPAEKRVEDLIPKMSVREKVAVLCTTAGFRMYEIVGDEVKPVFSVPTREKVVFDTDIVYEKIRG